MGIRNDVGVPVNFAEKAAADAFVPLHHHQRAMVILHNLRRLRRDGGVWCECGDAVIDHGGRLCAWLYARGLRSRLSSHWCSGRLLNAKWR